MGKHILVYGFYGADPHTGAANKGNLGDALFEVVFRRMFPDHTLTFTDRISKVKQSYDTMIIGGGSFLEFPISGVDEKVFKSDTPIFYLGVGSETHIHEHHQALMKRAKLIALRSNQNFEFIQSLNSNTIIIPDLVYSLAPQTTPHIKTPAEQKSILLLPNIACVPKYDDAAWKHNSWSHFKFEFAQMLDQLLEDGYSIQYMPMSTNERSLDDYAMVEVKNLMRKGHKITDIITSSIIDINAIIKLFACYGAIITQRFHGMILAEMANTPFLSIAHHDKLLQTSIADEPRGIFTSYYACNKSSLLKCLEQTLALSPAKPLSIDQHIYDHLKNEVLKHLE